MLLLTLLACLPDLGPRSAQAHAGQCGDCHVEEAEAFAGSRHADAASSELFRSLRSRAPDAAACDTCHAPERGWDCLTCHAAAGNQRTANGLLLHDPTGPVRGPTGHQDQAPHDSVADDFLTDSALCGTCHQLEGDGAFRETPYTHWKRSEAAAQGERCQDCHMPDAAGGGSDHGFAGLQADPVALLTAGLALRATADGVELVNHAGHALPDGAAFTRELWLEGRNDGVWTGEVHRLHPELHDADGRPTSDPFATARVVQRGLAPDEVRQVPFAADEVCLRYRPVASWLVDGPPPALEVVCVLSAPGSRSRHAP